MQTDKVCAVIVAAGSGTRMGGVSKPEIKLDGITLFERVLSAFCASDVHEIVVVAGENRPRLEAIAAPYTQKPIRFTNGGKTRSESVFNGVSAASKHCTLICAHDCARPFVTPSIIREVIDGAAETGASTACAKVTDTIKYVDEEHHSVYTPNRDCLLAIQTPQVFRKDRYEVAYALACKRGNAFTDETSMLEAAGARVAYVPTDPRNIKLTTKEDILLARAILLVRKAKEGSNA